MRALSTVLAGFIVIAALFFAAVVLLETLINSASRLQGAVETSVKRTVEEGLEKLRIAGVTLVSSNEVNVTIVNEGSAGVVLGPGCEVIVDLYNASGRRLVYILEYNSTPGWSILEVRGANGVLAVNPRYPIELYPGCNATLRAVLPSNVQISLAEPLVVVFTTRSGSRAEYELG